MPSTTHGRLPQDEEEATAVELQQQRRSQNHASSGDGATDNAGTAAPSPVEVARQRVRVPAMRLALLSGFTTVLLVTNMPWPLVEMHFEGQLGAIKCDTQLSAIQYCWKCTTTSSGTSNMDRDGGGEQDGDISDADNGMGHRRHTHHHRSGSVMQQLLMESVEEEDHDQHTTTSSSSSGDSSSSASSSENKYHACTSVHRVRWPSVTTGMAWSLMDIGLIACIFLLPFTGAAATFLPGLRVANPVRLGMVSSVSMLVWLVLSGATCAYVYAFHELAKMANGSDARIGFGGYTLILVNIVYSLAIPTGARLRRALCALHNALQEQLVFEVGGGTAIHQGVVVDNAGSGLRHPRHAVVEGSVVAAATTTQDVEPHHDASQVGVHADDDDFGDFATSPAAGVTTVLSPPAADDASDV